MIAVQPIEIPATLTQAAASQLREAIVSGELAPGTYIKEGELSKQLGLSVTPVREALVQLASEGLIEVAANRRKRVTPIDLQAMVELLEVQSRLWGMGYEWGAPKINPAQLELLHEIYRGHAKAIDEGDRPTVVAKAHQFHRIILEASGNRELVRISIDRLGLIGRFILLCAPEMASKEALEKHKSMLVAMDRKEFTAVTRLHQEACKLMVDVAKKLLNEQG